jgi:hypothetical protein
VGPGRESSSRSGKIRERHARLHLANLRTWRHDAYASRTFDPSEIDSLEKSLQEIAEGLGNGDVVVNVARQIVAQKRFRS